MSVDNTTTYSASSVITSPITARNQETNTQNTAFAAVFRASVAEKNTVGVLLREMETARQSENPNENNTQNKRNDKKNTETARLDNKKLDKTNLNQIELRDTAIKKDYTNQLDRREQIRNEYLNRLNKQNKQNEQNKSTAAISDPIKTSPQPINQPRLNSAVQPQITPTITNNNSNSNNEQIKFLNMSNHRAVVREVLGQDVSDVGMQSSKISATTLSLAAQTQYNPTRQTINEQQTNFTIFTPDGRIEEINYDQKQNNNQKQNNENNKNEKEKNRNKKDNLSHNNNLLTDVNSDILTDSYSYSSRNLPREIAELQNYEDAEDISGDDVIEIIDGEVDGIDGVDLSRLPEFVATILSDPVKLIEQIDLNNNTTENEKDSTKTDEDNYIETNTNDLDLDNTSRRTRLFLRVAAACRSMANRSDTFRIKLNLNTSGELFIRVKRTKNNYTITFVATNTTIAENLNKEINSLKQSLAEDNIKLNNVTVNVGQI